jgi:hypothetical protein
MHLIWFRGGFLRGAAGWSVALPIFLVQPQCDPTGVCPNGAAPPC